MKRSLLLALTGAVLAAASLGAQSAVGKPKRINKAIELLEQGQPIYYTHGMAASRRERNWPRPTPTTSTTRWSTAPST